MSLTQRVCAEVFGTFWLVFGGCGSAVLAAAFPNVGIGLLGVSLAFGLTVLTMAYAIGHVSGCHLNPAVSIGLTAARRFPARELPAYIGAQLTGAIVASLVLYIIASGAPDFSLSAGFASNGYGDHSPGHYSLLAAFTAELVLTFFFLFVILGATDSRAPAGFAPLPIGLCLTLIHLIGIPVSNVSVNPARSCNSCGCSGSHRSPALRSPASCTRSCSRAARPPQSRASTNTRSAPWHRARSSKARLHRVIQQLWMLGRARHRDDARMRPRGVHAHETTRGIETPRRELHHVGIVTRAFHALGPG
jgi:aquaporin Z